MFTNCSYGVYKRKVYYNQKKGKEVKQMKRTIYEVWAKTYSEELQDTIMVIKARFYKITDAQLFVKAYEESYMMKAVIIETETF